MALEGGFLKVQPVQTLEIQTMQTLTIEIQIVKTLAIEIQMVLTLKIQTAQTLEIQLNLSGIFRKQILRVLPLVKIIAII